MPVSLSDSVKSWASLLDDATRDQALSLGELPFIHPHIALMPDAHAGLGSAVGTVIPTVGVVIPAAVGVDIGCGMIAARTRYTAADLEGRDLTRLRDTLEHVIPLSPGNYNKRTDRFPFTAPRLRELSDLARRDDVDLSHSPHWKVQLGTLGGGNHFIELCLDEDDAVWMFLHSGSRGVGNKIARVHIRAAKEQCRREGVHWPTPTTRTCAKAPEFDRYLRNAGPALRPAQPRGHDGPFAGPGRLPTGFGENMCINPQLHRTRRHRRRPLWLTRRAPSTRAPRTHWSGAQSYVVEASATTGPASARTVPAALSRTQAKKSTPPTWRRPWVTSSTAPAGRVDEIPAAYKPIDVVMEDAAPLSIRHTLRQVLNVKGL